MRKQWLSSSVAAVLAVVSVSTMAQRDEVWPTGPIRLIVPAAPGGNPDILGRMLAQRLSAQLGRAVVVENQGGGGGMLAAGMVARASDANTLGILDSGSLTIAPSLSKAQGVKLSYDALSDFTPITALAAVPTILVVRPSLPVNTVSEFISYARSHPGAINFGSAGIGGIHHLTLVAFISRAEMSVTHVPYRGGALISTGLLGGELDAAFNGVPNVREHIASGRMRALAVSTRERLTAFPELPTVADSGFPGFDLTATIGMVARAGVSPTIVTRLQQMAARAMHDPELVQRLEAIGMIIKEDGTQNYVRLLGEETRLFEAVIQSAHIGPESK